MHHQSTPDFPSEEWKPVVGYEDFYSVSNLGRVRRDAPARGARAGHILKPGLVNGYLSIVLCKNGRRHTNTVHRLVTKAFLGPPPTDHEVNHIDGNKANACLANLEWVTKSENGRHASRNRLIRPYDRHGDKNPNAKLSNEQTEAIRELGKTTRASAIAARFGVHYTTIRRILRTRG